MNKENPLQRGYKKLYKAIKDYKRNLTSYSFKGQKVLVHDYDGSYFLFDNAFYVHFDVENKDKDGKTYTIEWVVVFSCEIEPQIFFYSDIFTILQYDEEYDPTWEKEKAYRPLKVHKLATDYIKKNNKTFTLKDFPYYQMVLIRTRYCTISLQYAFVEETEDYYYIYSEHHSGFGFKKKNCLSVTEIKNRI
jgi:hypothetical protein